jgi:hypothetical protein
MNANQKKAFSEEVALAKRCISERQYEQAMHHLERAHVLGQQEVGPHVLTHWLMLTVELHRARPVAAGGQVVRVVLGALGSAVGRVPTGNTGGSDVNMFEHMPIAEDLQRVMRGEE